MVERLALRAVMPRRVKRARFLLTHCHLKLKTEF